VIRRVQHQEPDFRALMERVQVVVEPSLASNYPRTWPARVTVETAAGQASREVGHTHGDPSHPFTWDDARAKASRVLHGLADAAAVDHLAAACRELGATTSVADLLPALSACKQRA
jgi:2-methylcitrate dehydratase PrpD